MRSHHLGLCGSAFLSLRSSPWVRPPSVLSAASLRTLALVTTCPLVMILIMRVMHAGSSNDAG